MAQQLLSQYLHHIIIIWRMVYENIAHFHTWDLNIGRFWYAGSSGFNLPQILTDTAYY